MSRSDDAAAVVAPCVDVDVVAAAVGVVVAGSRKLDQQPEAKRSDD